MTSERMDLPLAEEFRRLRHRFEELSRTAPPATLCLVKSSYYVDEPRKDNEFPCLPPPAPWSLLVRQGQWDCKAEIFAGHFAVERAMIRHVDSHTWDKLKNLAAQAARLLPLVPHDAWLRDSTWVTLSSPTENGWRWFNVVFDLALDIPRPRFLSVDNDERGGIFWWGCEDDPSRLFYVRGKLDGRPIRDHMRETGRWGAVIADMATQSMLAIDLILSRVGPVEDLPGNANGIAEGNRSRRQADYTKEQQAAWWYEWLCGMVDRDLTLEEAHEALLKLAADKERCVFPPWSPNEASWPSSKISLETFKKYLERARLAKQQRPRFAEGSSVVSSLPKSGTLRDDVRVVPPEVPASKHGRARQLRRAAADQAARDAEAAAFGGTRRLILKATRCSQQGPSLREGRPTLSGE